MDTAYFRKMRILIYGAGVIGSLYASLFSEAGIDTTVYARGQRLESLRQNGLRYEKNGSIQTANVRVLDALAKDEMRRLHEQFYGYLSEIQCRKE